MPSVLSINPGHDGAIAYLRDHSLMFSHEAEKDSWVRHGTAPAMLLLDAVQYLAEPPDAIAISGWEETLINSTRGAGYQGVGEDRIRRTAIKIMGIGSELYESTHERSHLFCSYGLSPFAQGTPCYMLNWEGQIGRFYEIDRDLQIIPFEPVVSFPGYKYSFLFDLADPSRRVGTWNLSAAGKLMALAAYSHRGQCTKTEALVIRQILDTVAPPCTNKEQFRDCPYFNCGVTNPIFLELVGKFSDVLFQKFLVFAKNTLNKGYPLLIGGGCGLNCEWNSRWKESGLFPDVFVPPVTNDSGTAIGTAIEAQYKIDGCAKISWSVYSGPSFIWDSKPEGTEVCDPSIEQAVEELVNGQIIAWVQDRCEIGPRALGHRSLLAAPFSGEMRDRLNAIKQREPYRPVAPICLLEDARELFGITGESPYMLEFQKVRVKGLDAVTHVDGSARAQTLSYAQNPELHRLLVKFKSSTGYGVLCNTSLNYPGRGFINRSSDLFRYMRQRGITCAVINGLYYRCCFQ